MALHPPPNALHQNFQPRLMVSADQTLVIQNVPADKRWDIAACVHVQAVDWAPQLRTQKSSLAGSVNFIQDKLSDPQNPKFLVYANYKDANSCILGMDNLERWLRDCTDWGGGLTVFIKAWGADGVPPISWRSYSHEHHDRARAQHSGAQMQVQRPMMTGFGGAHAQHGQSGFSGGFSDHSRS